ncbi:MAG TPA: ROK family protein [Vicinamibacterales bacterium]|nr:ROK family protein [Vicinamibacterales bacterium]
MRHLLTAKDEARDAAHLRRLNLERVLAASMAREGPFTRAELIEVTGLSAPTVGSLASHLIRTGLLTELGAGPSRGGRRPARMEFNARHGFLGGIDLGPTRTRIGLANLRGELLARRIVPTPHELEPTELLTSLAHDLRAIMREADVPASKLLVVGAGAPGAVDPSRGMVVALAPNLKGWSEVPMASILRRALGAAVVVDNDVNLAILGEHWKGAARGHDTCAFLSFGTGVGAGIMINGQLYQGFQFLAGEIGLMCMGPQYVGTDFGPHGCLETIVGLGALKQRWQPERSDREEWLSDLFRAAESGDCVAQQAVDELGTFVGMAAANVCSVLDPSLIVLGGAVIAQGEPLVERVRRVVQRIVPTPPPIVASSLDKDAPLWGSLLLASTEARERLRHLLAHGRAAD